MIELPTPARIDFRVAALAHMPVADEPIKLAQWDGQRSYFRLPSGRLNTISNNIHELGHYLVASWRWVHVPEFGLGEGPDVVPGSAPEWPLIGENDGWDGCDAVMHAEALASSVGIAIERALKLRWKNTARRHNARMCDLEASWSELQAMGLLDGGARPVFLEGALL